MNLYNLNKYFVIQCINKILKNKKIFTKQNRYKKINYVQVFKDNFKL